MDPFLVSLLLLASACPMVAVAARARVDMAAMDRRDAERAAEEAAEMARFRAERGEAS